MRVRCADETFFFVFPFLRSSPLRLASMRVNILVSIMRCGDLTPATPLTLYFCIPPCLASISPFARPVSTPTLLPFHSPIEPTAAISRTTVNSK